MGRIGYAAVEVYNTYADLTGGGNIVYWMSNGIIGHRSDVVVTDFGFKNVQPDAAYPYIGNGWHLRPRRPQLPQAGATGLRRRQRAVFQTANGLFTRYMTRME